MLPAVLTLNPPIGFSFICSLEGGNIMSVAISFSSEGLEGNDPFYC